ncbi:InlB B-repeat-containing protein [Rhodohalobacter sp.]|uniref:InlB B-repeat-containing protein n=1 Tax=Rhodohalobacter sp. TaxID=1974210 RepID=UPI002ACDD971|nr:hypothetical protein [Rhodohalobacter sp.]MDZ7757116.1 hypothetical protein [Rhodohalobacter sp.]
MKQIIFIVTSLFLLIAGCGDVAAPSDRVNISIIVAPSTAGNVLTSGGDEVGATAEFLAVANEGWQFSGWTGDVESTENPLNVELQSDIALTANFEVLSNNYRFDMQLTDGTTAELAFGQKPGATDSFDSGIDLESPPAPPEDVLHAWIEGDERDLRHDFRNSLNSEIVWDLIVKPGETGVVEMNWSRDDGFFEGSMVLTDEEESFKIDMLETNQTTLEINSTRNLQVRFGN